MRTSRILGALLVAAFVAACTDDPFLPRTAVEFTAPAVYETWWQMAQTCSGLKGDFSAVRWFSAPIQQELHDDPKAVAYWSSAGNHIVMHSDRKYDGPTIRHEMLHAIAREPKHTRDLFMDKCAGFVACDGNCITEAGKAIVPPNTPFVTPDKLLVDLKISDPFEIMDSGNDWFAVTVTVTNPSSGSVTVDLSTPLAPGADISFGYILSQGSGIYGTGNVVTTDAGLLTFGPGQTRQQVFDFFKSQMPPALWRVIGSYGTSLSGAKTIDTR